MKVIYKPYMIKALRDARHQVACKGREIEKIVLTHQEAEQLSAEIGIDYRWDRPGGFNVNFFEGVKLEVQ